MPLCQQKNCCALTALDGNYRIKPRALPWAVLWRPFRPCIRTAMLESHGFSIAGTAQVLRYGRLGSLRYNGLPWSCRFQDEISGLARIFHSHFGKSREKPYEKRGANTFECVVEKTRHAGLETCDTAGWEACATMVCVARFQRLMATVAANPGRCPGLSCCGLSGLLFAASFWMKKAMGFRLTERLRCCDTAGWEACATMVCDGVAGFTMKYPG